MRRVMPARTLDRWIRSVLLFSALLVLAVSAREVLAAEDPGISIEGCIGCHGIGTARPAFDVKHPTDVHYINFNDDGELTDSGYRQINIEVTSVDVTGARYILEFIATDENGDGVDNIFAADGRFVLAQLQVGVGTGDPNFWTRHVSGERFTTAGGVFEPLGNGGYRYSSVANPTTIPVAAGDTLRLAVQISAGDIPAGNGWCDFDANLAAANDCVSPVAITRDIVQTATCNECHGATSDTKLAFHGGGRTEVEYCVTCHDPFISGTGETEMTPLVHKIHYGSNLTNEYRGYNTVNFTRDIDNCESCHGDGSLDEDNWHMIPSRIACGSCHDDVNFDTGEGHGDGGIQLTNRLCVNCHPSDGPWTDIQFPVQTVHQGVARTVEAEKYRGDSNGYAISASYDMDTDEITIDFSITKEGQKVVLQNNPQWMNGARLAVTVGWNTDEFTNEESGSTPAPAQPLSFDGLDIGGVITDLGGGNYQIVVDEPDGASQTLTVALEGHPQADLRSNGSFGSIPVRTAFTNVSLERRAPVRPRRTVVDIAKCNACHDAAGAGLALHGNNRVSEMQACVVCHNPNATDIRQRPADPNTAIDGKKEESIDMKRMIHAIHTGKDLDNGLAVYGFGGFPHDYSHVGFIGNNQNCLSCHEPGTYSTDAAWTTLPSTIDTGDDVTDPSDDANISPISALCSSCHDGDRAKQHMLLNGGSFVALDQDIAIAMPEPGNLPLSLAACVTLGVLARRRFRQSRDHRG